MPGGRFCVAYIKGTHRKRLYTYTVSCASLLLSMLFSFLKPRSYQDQFCVGYSISGGRLLQQRLCCGSCSSHYAANWTEKEFPCKSYVSSGTLPVKTKVTLK